MIAFAETDSHLSFSFLKHLTMSRKVFLYSFLGKIPNQSPDRAFYTFSVSLISNFELLASSFTSMLIGLLICTFVGSLVSSFVSFSHQSLSLLRDQSL